VRGSPHATPHRQQQQQQHRRCTRRAHRVGDGVHADADQAHGRVVLAARGERARDDRRLRLGRHLVVCARVGAWRAACSWRAAGARAACGCSCRAPHFPRTGTRTRAGTRARAPRAPPRPAAAASGCWGAWRGRAPQRGGPGCRPP
jgi:hypothetical protein